MQGCWLGDLHSAIPEIAPLATRLMEATPQLLARGAGEVVQLLLAGLRRFF